MIISFKDVYSTGNLSGFSLEIHTSNSTVIYDPGEKTSCSILALLAGVNEIEKGHLRIDGIDYHEYFLTHEHLEVFSYIFDEGIMLANLNLKENLLLPYRKRFEDRGQGEFEKKVVFWLHKLEMDIDLSLRPVMVDAACRKFLSLIRGLLTEPELLLIDDPYYILNKTERQKMLDFLKELRKVQPMLIASADDDFKDGFADQVIDLGNIAGSDKPNPK